MLILGIDTSSRQSSIALLRVEAPGHEHTLELARLGEGRASEVLVPGIAALLERHGAAKSSLSLIGVASGPGSFTGLRVAIATAKGLAEAFATPVVAVSVLEAVALQANAPGPVIAALDAQRGELFVGEYIVDVCEGSAQRQREEVAGLHDFIARTAGSMVVTPDELVAGRLRESGVHATVVARPTAEEMARTAYRKLLTGERADVSALDANYLRRSDAEIVFSRKSGGSPQR